MKRIIKTIFFCSMICLSIVLISKPSSAKTITKKITLKAGESKTIKIKVKKYYSLTYSKSNSSIVSCKWGDTVKRKARLKITGDKVGKTTVTVKDKYSKNKTKIKVTVTSPVKIILPSVPYTLGEYSYDGKTLYQSFEITNLYLKDITYYSYDNHVSLYLCADGTNTYNHNGAGQSSSARISWKLYNENGAVVESDTMYSPSVSMGDSWVEAHDLITDLKPGTYRLEILNTN